MKEALDAGFIISVFHYHAMSFHMIHHLSVVK